MSGRDILGDSLESGYSAIGATITAPELTNPTTISGLVAWYDVTDRSTLFTDAGTTPVKSAGDAIYQVNDKSGNGRHATQTVSANRPLYRTSGFRLPYAECGGLPLYWNLPTAVTYLNTKAAVTVFSAGGSVDPTSGTTSGLLVIGDTQLNISVGTNGKRVSAGLRSDYPSGTFFSVGNAADAYAIGDTQVTTGLYEPAAGRLSVYENGALVQTRSDILPAAAFNFDVPGYLGSKYYPANQNKVALFEVIVFHRACNATERANIEAYLRAKYLPEH